MVSESEVGIDTAKQMKWIHDRLKGDGVILVDNEKVATKFRTYGYKTTLEESDNLVYLECDNLEDMKRAYDKCRKKLFITTRELTFYELYDFFEPLIDSFKIYNIINYVGRRILVAEVWKNG